MAEPSLPSRAPVGDRWTATWLDRVMLRSSGGRVWVPWLALAVLVAAIWAAVYVSGGTRIAMTHLFYLPIILGALLFGLRGAVVVAVASAVACGPVMPLDTLTGEQQHTISWIVRGVMFVVVGVAVAVALMVRERSYERQLSGELLSAMSPPAPTPVPDPDDDLAPLVGQVLAQRLLHCVYQPVYSLADGRLIGVEALARIEMTPYRSPDRWFAAAAAAGIGPELELLAIETGLAGLLQLPRGLSVSVNASPATIADPRLLELVRATPDRPVTVEITEHAIIQDYHRITEHLRPLREAGVRIAVDDAGAGFASLQHIVQIAPDIVKLDMSLAQHVATSPVRRALAGSLIEFAQQSGALLVVEGIEEEPDLAIWSALGAHAVQGFLVGRPGPLPAPASHALITSLNRRSMLA